MSENYVLIADSPDLQSKFAHTTQKKQADHCKGENNLDRFNIRTAGGSGGGGGYNGYFKVTPVAGERKVHISGGKTDCGYVEAGELDVSQAGSYVDIHLVVIFTPYDEDDLASGGEYTFEYSTTGGSGDVYRGSWLLATAEVRDSGVTVTQQWCGGEILFGSIYWLP